MDEGAIGDIYEEPSGARWYRAERDVMVSMNRYHKQSAFKGFPGKRTGETLPLATGDVGDDRQRAQELAHATLSETLRAAQARDLQRVSRYSYVVLKRGFLMPEVYAGPCHARLNNGEPVLALCTAPNIEGWYSWNFGSGSRGGLEDRFEVEAYPAEADRFWYWLTTESHLANVFLEKVSPEEVHKGGVLLDVYCPGNLTCQAITASRLPHEFPGRIRLWDKLVQRGVDPLIALGLCECFESKAMDGKYFLSMSRDMGGIHDMFSSRISIESLRRMRDLEIVSANDPMSKCCMIRGQHKMWDRDNDTKRLRDVACGLVTDNAKAVEWSWTRLALKKTMASRWASYEGAVDQVVEMGKTIKESIYYA
jgi:hypothetical protein